MNFRPAKLSQTTKHAPMTTDDDPPEEAQPASKSAQDERKAMDTLTDNVRGGRR